ncbi:MAG: hypothetical protein DCC58_03935 [Chloroflexi bacterium]|nr:MAG: hypothetical protein DCC58_03935 [Chloroflexota bacterium]
MDHTGEQTNVATHRFQTACSGCVGANQGANCIATWATRALMSSLPATTIKVTPLFNGGLADSLRQQDIALDEVLQRPVVTKRATQTRQ